MHQPLPPAAVLAETQSVPKPLPRPPLRTMAAPYGSTAQAHWLPTHSRLPLNCLLGSAGWLPGCVCTCCHDKLAAVLREASSAGQQHPAATHACTAGKTQD